MGFKRENVEILLLCLIVVFVSCDFSLAKECTNLPPEMVSHTIRYQIETSNDQLWKEKMFLHYDHLTPTDTSTWASLLPRKGLKEGNELSWMMLYRKMQNSDGFKVPEGFLKEMSLHNVRLDPNSLHGKAQNTNLEYLLMLDPDRLVWSFRNTAGLPTPGEPYGGWEAPKKELRGHFVGHYLSAAARMWASTHNDTIKERMSAVVSALSECQNKIGTGYLSAFPSEFFERLEELKYVWAPYYTIHKIMAGLVDQHLFANSSEALEMVTRMADYFYNRVKNVIMKYSIERHYDSLNDETGGMNDVLYTLFSITRDPKHLVLAHLFDKPCFLGILAVQADNIADYHANTHIPVVIGAQRRYEITGDPLYREIAKFLLDVVNASHTYATGGTSEAEFWGEPNRLASYLRSETEESCTTYNMLKVSRQLFTWTKEIAYADYYERALTNGVLSIQRGTEPGIMIYFLPLGHGQSKAVSKWGWGTKNDSFWCCYGTGIESFSKLGDSIYFEQDGIVPELYIIQFISSTLDWNSPKISIVQKVKLVVSWDNHLHVVFKISPKEESNQSSTLHLRIPFWAHSNGVKAYGGAALLNEQVLSLPDPGNFLSITRKWSHGDKIALELPISIRTEAIQDDRPEYASDRAIFYGPYLLVGLTNGDRDINTEAVQSPLEWMTPVPPEYNSHVVTLSQESENTTLAFSNTNDTIAMIELPEPGSNHSVHATFRLIPKETTSSKSWKLSDVIGKQVMLEPFDHPGMVLMHQGEDQNLGITNSSDSTVTSFRIVEGLDGKNKSVSLESESDKGCFVYSDGKLHDNVKLKCSSKSKDDDAFRMGASFGLRDGVSKYDPISFVAKGGTRSFLLQPLLRIRDEHYVVYFNFKSRK